MLTTYGVNFAAPNAATTTQKVALPNKKGSVLRAISVTTTNTANQGPFYVTLNVSDSASGFVVFLRGGVIRTDGNVVPDLISWDGTLPCESEVTTQQLNVQVRNDSGSAGNIAVRYGVDTP